LSVVARPPRVGSRSTRTRLGHGRQQRRDQAVQRRGVGDDGGLELQRLALRQHRHAVVADGAGQQHHVARPRVRAADVAPVGQHADAGGADEHAVALALLDHLGVAGDDGHAGLARRRGHRLDDALAGRPAEALPRG
jgi:hypothetical protein